MTDKNFPPYHPKTGIVILISLLIGAVVTLGVLFITGNKIIILNSADSVKMTEKDTVKHTQKTKRYNIYNYYYPKDNGKTQQTHYRTDTLPVADTINYVTITRYSANKTLLDINASDTYDLQTVRGIGKVFAGRIYRYGKRLGGYVSTEQLKEVYGMTDSLYEAIVENFTIKSSFEIKKININSADIKTLCSHPYIDRYLAKEIIIYRDNNGRYKDITELKLIHLIDDSTFNKIYPYVCTE